MKDNPQLRVSGKRSTRTYENKKTGSTGLDANLKSYWPRRNSRTKDILVLQMFCSKKTLK